MRTAAKLNQSFHWQKKVLNADTICTFFNRNGRHNHHIGAEESL